MRTSVSLAGIAALVLVGCGTDAATPVPTVTATDSDTPITTPSPTHSEGDEAEGEPRAEDALFGEDVCIALLPALDGNLTGLERYAEPEVLEVLYNDSDEGLAEFAETYASDDGMCTIAVGDWWVDLELLGDGHVGQRAVAFTAHSTYGDADAEFQARTEAVAAYRTDDPAACDGEVGDLYEGQDNHLAFGLGTDLVVAVLCDNFAYQSTWELKGWDGAVLFEFDVEQWTPDGLVTNDMILGYPDLDQHGRLVNLEKARGPGDCGTYQVWDQASDDQLLLVEARSRACDDGTDYVEPDQWPLVHPSGE